MCRFLIYKGKPIIIAELITKPAHSLIKQSVHSRERKEPLNGDGFGLGWYAPSLSQEPALFTSLTPAWGNRNLRRLVDKIQSPCLFAHIRAASKGLMVSEVNCHPFQYRNLLWMHNGVCNEFYRIKRILRQSLKDEFYHMISGTTDSEHAFALFLNFLPEGKKWTLSDYKRAMVQTIKQLNLWSKEAGIEGKSMYNFALSDGENIVVTRYATHGDEYSETLDYSSGTAFECDGDVCHMINPGKGKEAIIVSSEPLTDLKEDWKPVPIDHLLAIDAANNTEIIPINI